MILTSKNNPLVKETAALKDKKARKECGLFLVEGYKMALECQKSKLEIERVFVAESYRGELPDCQAEPVYVSDGVFRFLSDEKSPQGVLCRVRIPDTALCAPKGKCLLLDGVADPGNVGTILRTANAAGYEEVYLTQECADPFSPKCVRASMSGVFFTKIYRGERSEILSVLGDIPVLIADMGGANVFHYVAPKRFVLVIGNEANGVSDEVRARATHTVKIPMRSTQESLNAAISAGIIMYVLQKDEFID
ncbi:MAG: RNA methyltransferase [Clostridia bacterium]|nr:RNA methyltransferase [Clostridia bacterium]